MINKIINKETTELRDTSSIGYVLCTQGTSKLTEGTVYALYRDEYRDRCSDDGEYFVDLIVNGNVMYGFYTSRFIRLTDTEVKEYLRHPMSALKDFESY